MPDDSGRGEGGGDAGGIAEVGAADSFGDESGALEFSVVVGGSGGGGEKSRRDAREYREREDVGVRYGAAGSRGGERGGELCTGVGAIPEADPQAAGDRAGGEDRDRDRRGVE